MRRAIRSVRDDGLQAMNLMSRLDPKDSSRHSRSSRVPPRARLDHGAGSGGVPLALRLGDNEVESLAERLRRGNASAPVFHRRITPSASARITSSGAAPRSAQTAAARPRPRAQLPCRRTPQLARTPSRNRPVRAASSTASQPMTNAIIATQPGCSPVPARRRWATKATSATAQAPRQVATIACVPMQARYHTDSVDKLEHWQQTGGTLRVVELSEQHAVVDLCACTGEVMERWSTRDPAVIRRLHAAAGSVESASSGGESEP